MRPRRGFFAKLTTFLATLIMFRLRGKKEVVRFGSRPHPLLTVGFLEDLGTYLASALALIAAAIAAALTFLSGRIDNTALAVAAAGAFLAALVRPKRAWRWWLIMAVTVPLSMAAADHLEFTAADAWQKREWLRALWIPFVAAYGAVILRAVSRKIAHDPVPNRSAGLRS